MICSILLPSCRRLEKLKRCILSLAISASHPANMEIILALRSDDLGTLAALPELLRLTPNIKAIIGPPLRGYSDHPHFYQEAALLAVGKWVWTMGDDVVVSGNGWDVKLALCEQGVVQPEVNQLNESRYERDKSCPFMFLPNKSWGGLAFGNPLDEWVFQLAKTQGWPTSFLPGIEVWHDNSGNNVI